MSVETADALHERNRAEYRRRYAIAKHLIVGFSSGRSLWSTLGASVSRSRH